VPPCAAQARPEIGDSITHVPGVSAASFGPNASRPVLRGLTGERVRVLTDGIGAFDVSNAAADLAVATDLLTALRIEVVRGPATLRGRVPNHDSSTRTATAGIAYTDGNEMWTL
jgi:iron complex outermembrane receptor protein